MSTTQTKPRTFDPDTCADCKDEAYRECTRCGRGWCIDCIEQRDWRCSCRS